MPDHPTDFQAVVQDVSDAAVRFADALRAAMAPHCDSAQGVRALGRRLDIDKNIASAALRIVRAPDAPTVLAALPGVRATDLLLRAIRAAGASPDLVEGAERAHAALRQVLDSRGYDPRALRVLAAGSQDSKRVRGELRRAHRAAFEAGRVIWGYHLRARIGATLITPNADGEHCDMAAMTLLHDIDRLGPGPAQRVYAPMIRWTGDTPAVAGAAALGSHPRIPALVEKLSSARILPSEVDAGEGPEAGHAMFKARSASRTGPLDLAFGEVVPRIGTRFRGDDDTSAEVSLPIGMPMAFGIIDVLLHRDLPRGGDPVAAHFGSWVRPGAAATWSGALRLPLHDETQVVAPGELPHALRAAAPAYGELLQLGVRSLGKGLRLQDFECFRLAMPFPPMPTSLVMRWRLADPPK